MTGNYVGLYKNGLSYFIWYELRAYEMPPMTLTVSMLSTNILPNTTLINALGYSMTSGQSIGLDLAFSATGTGVYWMVDFG